jgi:membrane protein DedA with SNARE-associated domain
MESMGYLGIGLLMFLENLFPPIPSELIMPLAGFTVAKGNMNFWLAVLAGVVGTVVGALPWYYAGMIVSEPRLRDLADRYGKWLTISGKDIDRANFWFTKHGMKAVLLCRLVPAVRTIISLPAGINAMPIVPFIIFSTIGTAVWVTFLTALGYFLGDNYELVDQYLAPLSKVVVITIFVAIGFWVIRRRRKFKGRRRRVN